MKLSRPSLGSLVQPDEAAEKNQAERFAWQSQFQGPIKVSIGQRAFIRSGLVRS